MRRSCLVASWTLPVLMSAACQQSASPLAEGSPPASAVATTTRLADQGADGADAGGPSDRSDRWTQRDLVRNQAQVVFLIQQIRWLAQESVQRELSLTEDQRSAVQAVVDSAKERFDGMRTLSPTRREMALQTEWVPAAAELRERVLQLLESQQLHRLGQIVLQNQVSAIAFASPHVSAELELSAEQQQFLEENVAKTIYDFDPTSRNAYLELLEMLGNGRRGHRLVLERLTDEQRETWKRLLGDPF